MTNDIEKLKEALKSANDICRSFHSIVERIGDDVNWFSMRDQLEKSLKLQHDVMYPETYNKSNIHSVKVENDEDISFIDEDGAVDWDAVNIDNFSKNPCIQKEVDLHQTMDANVWSSEFCKAVETLYKIKIEKEWVHSWMCNTLMCGWDHQSWKRDKEYIYILKTCGGDILKVFHWEPTEKDIREEYVKHYPEDMVGKDYDVWNYIRLYRWSRSYGLTEMNGPKSDTQYEWKAVNQ